MALQLNYNAKIRRNLPPANYILWQISLVLIGKFCVIIPQTSKDITFLVNLVML